MLRMLFSYIFGIMSDWLLKTKRLTLTEVRKLATFMCTIFQGFLTLGLGSSGCHSNLAIIFMMTGTAVNGAVSSGTLAVFVDLSSNYASVILGFCNLIAASSGFLSPLLVGLLTTNNVSFTSQFIHEKKNQRNILEINFLKLYTKTLHSIINFKKISFQTSILLFMQK